MMITRSPNTYIQEANLTVIAATYFVVEAELPNTISVAATSAVQSSTFAEVRPLSPSSLSPPPFLLRSLAA